MDTDPREHPIFEGAPAKLQGRSGVAAVVLVSGLGCAGRSGFAQSVGGSACSAVCTPRSGELSPLAGLAALPVSD